MGLRIGTNLAAISAMKHIRQNQQDVSRSMSQLASGSRFSSPGEDPASFSISEHLRGQTQGLQASRRNAENAISFVQVAEGGLHEQNNILIRMRELAIQAASDTVSKTERRFLDQEFQMLKAEVDRIAQTTQYGSNKLLLGSGKSLEFQVGANKGKENVIAYNLEANTTARSLDIDRLDVEDDDDATDAIAQIDRSLDKLGSARASFGAIQSRLEYAVNHLASQEVSVENARSIIADTDVAKAVTDMTMGQLRSQYQVAVMAQANSHSLSALKLLQG